MNYNFIAIEGNIGAGKSTLAGKLATDYNARLVNEQFEDNSFLPKFYKNPDKYAFPLELSFLAERYQQMKNVLSSGDLFHDFIVADYFIGKSLVFAKKTLQPDEFALYSRLYTIINTTLPPPDLIVYLYMGIDQLQENIRKRGRSYEQEIPDEYLKQIQESYFEFMQQREDLRIVVIDANDIDFVKNHAEYEALKRIIFNTSYEKGIHRIKP